MNTDSTNGIPESLEHQMQRQDITARLWSQMPTTDLPYTWNRPALTYLSTSQYLRAMLVRSRLDNRQSIANRQSTCGVCGGQIHTSAECSLS